MLKSFNKEEKMALISILKFMINSEGKITETELTRINELAEEKGFEDFHEIFDDVDKNVHAMNDIISLIKKVKNESHKKDILRYASELAITNGSINPQEGEVIQLLKKEWNL